MFNWAKTKLTLLYILIVSIVSICFSLIIYRDILIELQKSYQTAEYKLNNQPDIYSARRSIVLSYLADELDQTKKMVLFRLALINSFIISLSGIAAYFLAQKTLQPIENAVEEQKRFISDASHELKTPLTAMKSEIEVTLRDKNISLQELKKLLNSNLEEVNKMQNLTNYLLSLNRYESENLEFKKEKFNLGDTVNNVLEKYKISAKDKNIVFKLKIKNLIIRANKTSVEELLSIFIDNSIKYSKNNGEIYITIKQSNKHATIEIKDNGIGIKASDIPYIFNRFYRADTSRNKNENNGYGLGLSIAKSIVDLHGGNITTESTPEKGTKFTINLPL